MCPDENQLMAFASGALADPDVAALERHLDACRECRAVLAALGSAAPAVETSLPAEGSTLGRFRVLRRLGSGAMGVVFLAFDPQLERRVALKLVPAAGDATALDEARALARLNHPHVVHVHEALRLGAFDAIAMEYVEGESLREWLATPRRRAQLDAVLLQAAEGLAAAHRAGIVHRDFKPENVLVGADGRVRVGDFGLSRPAPAAAASAPLVTSRAGTPAYLAPEVAAGGAATPRSDQYSLCVTALEALTGARPSAAAPASPRPGLAPWLRGLESDPSRRWADVDALVARLRRRASLPRRLGLAGTLLLAAGVTTWSLGRAQPLPTACASLEARVAGLWSVERARALEVTAAALSPTARARLLQLAAENSAAARALVAETCVPEADPARAQLQFLRLECLERVVRANARTLEGLATPADVPLGAYQLLLVRPGTQCSDERQVRAQASTQTAGVGGSGDPARYDALHDAFERRELATVRAGLEPALAEARRSGDHHGTARLVRLRALLKHDDGDLQGEVADLTEALGLCEAHGFDTLLLELTQDRMRVASNEAEAKVWFELASQRARRVGRDEALAGDLSQSLGLTAWSLGDLGEAVRHLRRAAQTWREALTADDPMVASTEALEGRALVELGRFAEARVVLVRGAAALERAFGAQTLHRLEPAQGLLRLALFEERAADAARLLPEFERLRRASDGDGAAGEAEALVYRHWLATLSGVRPPLPAASPAVGAALAADEDLTLTLATAEAETCLDAMDLPCARRALARHPHAPTPLGALALALDAEASADPVEAQALAREVLARPEGRSSTVARAHAHAVLARLGPDGERAAHLTQARALAPEGSRLARRLGAVR